MANILTFETHKNDGGLSTIVPQIDGIALTKIVGEFEVKAGFTDPAGGYDGIIPAMFNVADLTSYFLGKSGAKLWGGGKRIAVLGCSCAEPGCWPFVCSVDVQLSKVQWLEFQQPHRPRRNYTSLGPYVFDRSDYDKAISELDI